MAMKRGKVECTDIWGTMDQGGLNWDGGVEVGDRKEKGKR